jgi:hypothetical protein
MHGDDLAIILFLLTLGTAFGVEAVKAETLLRRAAFGGLAAFFLLTGLFWLQLKKLWPPLTEWAASIATNPMSWFIVFILVVAIFAFHRPKKRKVETSDRDTELTALKAHLASILKDQATLKAHIKLAQVTSPPGTAEKFRQLDRTTFLLSTAAVDDIYRKRLELCLEPISTRRNILTSSHPFSNTAPPLPKCPGPGSHAAAISRAATA